ncbi:MAG: hypothetical protein R3E95_13440 [Thiolinea sp.]
MIRKSAKNRRFSCFWPCIRIITRSRIYCKQELEWFPEYQRQRGGIRFNNDSRLFNILLNNIHHEQWLPAFAGVGCFPLHDAPEKSQEFGQPIAPDGFGTHLRKLVDNTADLLGALREAEAASPVREAPPTTDRPRVFIAHVADTLKPFRQRLISEISAQATSCRNCHPRLWHRNISDVCWKRRAG